MRSALISRSKDCFSPSPIELRLSARSDIIPSGQPSILWFISPPRIFSTPSIILSNPSRRLNTYITAAPINISATGIIITVSMDNDNIINITEYARNAAAAFLCEKSFSRQRNILCQPVRIRGIIFLSIPNRKRIIFNAIFHRNFTMRTAAERSRKVLFFTFRTSDSTSASITDDHTAAKGIIDVSSNVMCSSKIRFTTHAAKITPPIPAQAMTARFISTNIRSIVTVWILSSSYLRPVTNSKNTNAAADRIISAHIPPNLFTALSLSAFHS